MNLDKLNPVIRQELVRKFGDKLESLTSYRFPYGRGTHEIVIKDEDRVVYRATEWRGVILRRDYNVCY